MIHILSQFNKEENNSGEILKSFCLKDKLTYGSLFFVFIYIDNIVYIFLLIYLFRLNNILVVKPVQLILSISNIYKSFHFCFGNFVTHQLFIRLSDCM